MHQFLWDVVIEGLLFQLFFFVKISKRDLEVITGKTI